MLDVLDCDELGRVPGPVDLAQVRITRDSKRSRSSRSFLTDLAALSRDDCLFFHERMQV